jgi:hypothetical protein
VGEGLVSRKCNADGTGGHVDAAPPPAQTHFSIVAAALAKPSLQKYVPLLQGAGLDDALLADVDGDGLEVLLADALAAIAPACRKLIGVETKKATAAKRGGSGGRTACVGLFERADTSRDGAISFWELCALMSDVGFSDEEIHAMAVAADADGSGGLSVAEAMSNFAALFAFE